MTIVIDLSDNNDETYWNEETNSNIQLYVDADTDSINYIGSGTGASEEEEKIIPTQMKIKSK